MKPSELSSFLRRLAANLESAPAPTKKMVVHGVEYALRSVQAASVVDRDYSTIVHSMDSLIKHLVQAIGDSDDESRAVLERSVDKFKKLKTSLTREFKNLAKVDL